jgi:hypothetical protein
MRPTRPHSGSLVASCRVHARPQWQRLMHAPAPFAAASPPCARPLGAGASCMCLVAVGSNASSLAAAAFSAPLAGSMLAVPLARAGAYSLHSLILFRTIIPSLPSPLSRRAAHWAKRLVWQTVLSNPSVLIHTSSCRTHLDDESDKFLTYDDGRTTTTTTATTLMPWHTTMPPDSKGATMRIRIRRCPSPSPLATF